jgi:hypothetical protein
MLMRRKLCKSGIVEIKYKRDIPGGPRDGYRKTTRKSRKAEYVLYVDTMGNDKKPVSLLPRG